MNTSELEDMRHAMNRLRAQASRGAEMWTDPIIRETNIVMDILARSKPDEKEVELVILRSDRENLHARVRELRGTIDSLMAKLADLLDEDHFHDCEDICRKAGVTAPASTAKPCRSCKGVGTEPDWIGDDMRCVEVACSVCSGTGLAKSEAEPLLSSIEKNAQASRCSCHGADDYCPCQNVADQETVRQRRSTITNDTK